MDRRRASRQETRGKDVSLPLRRGLCQGLDAPFRGYIVPESDQGFGEVPQMIAQALEIGRVLRVQPPHRLQVVDGFLQEGPCFRQPVRLLEGEPAEVAEGQPESVAVRDRLRK